MKKIDFSGRARRRRAVAWHVAGGWLSNLIFIVQGLLLIPLYIHHLGDRLYGFWLATGGVLAWVAMVDVGAAAVTQQRCAAAFGRRDMEAVVRYFWHGAVVIAGVLAAVGALLGLAGVLLPGWLAVDAEYRGVIRGCFFLAGLGVVGRMGNDFMRYFASALQRNQVPVLAQTFGDLAGLVGILVFLLVLDFGLWSLALGAVLRALLPMAVNLAHTIRILGSIGIRNRWSKAVFRDYGTTTPAVLAAKASGTFAQNLAPVVITRFIGPEATVAYTVSIRAVQILQGFINQALAGLYAACAHYFGDPSVDPAKRHRIVGDLARGYFVASGVGVCLFALFNHGFVALWTSEERFAGQLFTSAVAIGSFLVVRDKLFNGLASSLGEIRRSHLAKAAGNSLTAALIVLGVLTLGMIGAPLAGALAGLVIQFVYFRLFRGVDPKIAKGLRPLLWLWAPLALFLAALYPISEYFVVDSWPRFLAYCALASAPFGLAFVLGLPGMKKKVLRLFRRFVPAPSAV